MQNAQVSPKGERSSALYVWVRKFGLPSRLSMDRLFDKKSKNSHKSSRRHFSLGIPTNIAIGPLGFRAELDIDPKGGEGLPVAIWEQDSSPMLDENIRASRIVFHDKKSESQNIPPPETPTSHAAVGSNDHRNGSTGERVRSLLSRPMLTRVSVPPPTRREHR